jgi:transposase
MPKSHPPYPASFRADAVTLVHGSGKSIAEVAVDLGVSNESLRKWLQQAKVDADTGPPGALTTEERDELRRLRRENKTLQMEREILRKAAAFFAREAPSTGCGSSTRRRPALPWPVPARRRLARRVLCVVAPPSVATGAGGCGTDGADSDHLASSMDASAPSISRLISTRSSTPSFGGRSRDCGGIARGMTPDELQADVPEWRKR